MIVTGDSLDCLVDRTIAMAKSTDEKKRDEALKRALTMPPQPHGGKIDKPPPKKKKAAKKRTKSAPK
ncbi:hypothetical protein [Hyphococcus aureus]|uniref:Uncharacterized protein n=1 Tax=Hyphococcus aureus TaxID=2666033 RepID=A0ABW1KXI5_9PROT